MPSSKSPRREFKNTMNVSTNCFRRPGSQDAEQKRRFLAKFRPEIRKLCVVRTFTDIEELVGAATELERVLGELGETPYEPLREEQEEETSETMMEKQVTVLNNTLINFFKGTMHNPKTSFSSTAFGGCQICKGGDHLATTCPRLNEARPKCAKCGMPHRTENCGIKCTFLLRVGAFRRQMLEEAQRWEIAFWNNKLLGGVAE